MLEKSLPSMCAVVCLGGGGGGRGEAGMKRYELTML